MDLEFARECLRRDIKPDPHSFKMRKNAEGRRGPVDWVALTIYYATNRTPTARVRGSRPMARSERRKLGYGRAEISIPTSRRPGELRLPSLWQLESKADPSKQFHSESVQPLNNDVAQTELSAKLAAADSKSILIFVTTGST